MTWDELKVSTKVQEEQQKHLTSLVAQLNEKVKLIASIEHISEVTDKLQLEDIKDHITVLNDFNLLKDIGLQVSDLDNIPTDGIKDSLEVACEGFLGSAVEGVYDFIAAIIKGIIDAITEVLKFVAGIFGYSGSAGSGSGGGLTEKTGKTIEAEQKKFKYDVSFTPNGDVTAFELNINGQSVGVNSKLATESQVASDTIKFIANHKGVFDAEDLINQSDKLVAMVRTLTNYDRKFSKDTYKSIHNWYTHNITDGDKLLIDNVDSIKTLTTESMRTMRKGASVGEVSECAVALLSQYAKRDKVKSRVFNSAEQLGYAEQVLQELMKGLRGNTHNATHVDAYNALVMLQGQLGEFSKTITRTSAAFNAIHILTQAGQKLAKELDKK